MFIMFEGVDKSGKSTLVKKLNEVTDYKHWVLDRGIISSIVYNDIYNRKNEKMYFEYLEKLKALNPLIVYTFTTKEEIELRLKQANEMLPKKQIELGIEKIQNKFFDYIQKSGLRYIVVSTNKPIVENLNFILKAIEKEDKNER